ncbi:hypothetical protein HOD75_04715 [archaeon]|jgi:hypothetical protein|nr:hypothetical protein [archaeon]MBT4242167.1 hypothetical protein [archaeon]MBT4417855.1 hypothetical protein [archaeon]
MEKQGKAGIIILIIVIILILIGGIGAFFVLRDSRAIPGYTYEIPDFEVQEICDEFGEVEGDVCVKATDSIFYKNEDESNDIIVFEITKGVSDLKSFLKSTCEIAGDDCEFMGEVMVFYRGGVGGQEAFTWYYSDYEYVTLKQWGDNPGSDDSDVVKFYLNKYPPIQI